MDGMNLVLYLTATFLGGLTSGLTGFAAGLVVSGVWLHIITPFADRGTDRGLRHG